LENNNPKEENLPQFERKFFESTEEFMIMGSGAIGGKAQGLLKIKHFLDKNFPDKTFQGIEINIPRLAVITSEHFDFFMEHNNLYEIALSDESDTYIANKFQKAELPVDIVGDLRGLISKVKTPLAVRSSSILEDAMYEPFAGIYTTKMIPNNQIDEDSRFRKLTESIKLVYASTFFKNAKDYLKGVGKKPGDEKMSVIIQEVVGTRFGSRYYPEISGVARSYNYYSFGKTNPEDGIVNLALGLGKTIVDGGISWSFSPSFPNLSPPFVSIKEMIDNTQRNFWSVNMQKPVVYDPVNEAECLNHDDINTAEKDETLDLLCSTYDAGSDRLRPGTGYPGPKILNFNPVLDLNMISLNAVIKEILKISRESQGVPVEIEFALTLKKDGRLKPRLGFLQVRPMVVSSEDVEITEEDTNSENLMFGSEKVLGNGIIDTIQDIVFVKPETFDIGKSEQIADEIEKHNMDFYETDSKYMLLGFGRWGSTDKWLGIPVNWGQISGAKVIIEAMLPEFNVELSQGSHFFHNINSFQVLYFTLNPDLTVKIDWSWLNSCDTVKELDYTKHIKLKKPLLVKVDGKKAVGVILK